MRNIIDSIYAKKDKFSVIIRGAQKLNPFVTDLLGTLNSNRGFIDDHNGKKTDLNEISGLIFRYTLGGGVDICPAYRSHFCMNPLYIEGEDVHLSTCSVAGTLKPCRDPESAQEAIQEYYDYNMEYGTGIDHAGTLSLLFLPIENFNWDSQLMD